MLAVKSGTSGELLAKLLDAYRTEPGAAAVDLLLCEAHQHQKLLQNGQADVALLHLPWDSTAGLDTEILYTERQVAILPASPPTCPALADPAGRGHRVARPPDGSLARSRRPLSAMDQDRRYTT